ncbi:MAG: hypothetical protein IIA88_05040 [Bacteroidetes bacterium]|nr:hypothetical protein [Bacteroidota bacterium]
MKKYSIILLIFNLPRLASGFRFAQQFSPIIIGISLCLTIFNFQLKAQDDLMDLLEEEEQESEHVIATFKTTRLINAHTIETVGAKNLDFRITHRFGNVGGSSGGINTLYGFDNVTDIRLAFEYGVTDNLTIGVGRSKGGFLDGFIKYKALQQTADNKIPFAVTLLANTGLKTVGKDGIADSLFKYAYRHSYVFEAIIARKFSSNFSFELIPLLIHRNIVEFNDENDLFALGVGLRYKFTPSMAILLDYFYTFSDIRTPDLGYYAPLGVSFEIETGGHVFQITFTNVPTIVENQFIPDSPHNWQDWEFKFGFNISRVFQF